MRSFPFSAGTDTRKETSADAPAAFRSPYRLRGVQWRSATKAAGKEFLADDCMGLAQEIAYSSLLAFFPSVILVVGLLGLFGPGAYESLTHLLGSVAPKGVLDMIKLAKDSSTHNKAGSAIAFSIGLIGALWASTATSATCRRCPACSQTIRRPWCATLAPSAS